METPERGGEPPGMTSEQRQCGREEEAADEQGIGEDGDRRTEAEDLEDDDVRDAKDADRGGEEDRRGGDDSANSGDAAADRLPIGATFQSRLAHPTHGA